MNSPVKAFAFQVILLFSCVIICPAQPAVDARALDALIKKAWMLRDNDPDRSSMLADSIIELAARNRLKRQEASAWSVKGNILCSGDKKKSGYEAYSRAFDIRALMGDSIGMAIIYNNIANFKQNEGKCEDALDSIRQGIQLLSRMAARAKPGIMRDSALSKLALSYSTLSNIYGDMGGVSDIQEGISAARDAIRFAGIARDSNEMAEGAFCLANRFYALFDKNQDAATADSSLLYYARAMDYYQGHAGNENGIVWGLHNQAVILTDKGEYGKAWELLGQCEAIFKAQHDSSGIWNVLVRKGWHKQVQHKYTEAMPYFKAADSYATQALPLGDMLYFCERMAEQYEKTGDPARALAFQKRAYNLRDSILNEDVVRKADNLKIELETEKSRIVRLEAEKVKSENNLMRIIGGGAILVLVFILLFTFWFLKARADNNLLRGLADGREQTLRDVSDRLHTEVQSELAKALKSVQALSVEHGDVAPALADIKLANTMVRDLSHDLSVTLLKYSTLQEVLWEYCEKIMERKTGLHASFTETGSNHILPKEVELALYRIAQSCTNNTLKHASAQHISMSLNCSEKMVFFQYSDDGKGFDFDQAITRGRSIGLRDMVERVKLLKGEIQPFQPAAGGAGVLISIPL